MFLKLMVIIAALIKTPVIGRAFEKIVYYCYARKITESHVSTSQFAYRKGGNCTDALLSTQHRFNSYVLK